MQEQLIHEHRSIDDVLSEKVTLGDNVRAFYKEMKTNLRLEAACIAACETGEWGTEALAYLINAPFMNELGLAGGISVGASYAIHHVYRHARARHKTPSFGDAAGYVATTESGCIIGATLTEYSLGKFATRLSQNPVSTSNIIVRGLGLIPAFGIGLVLMSAFTFRKQEIARWAGEKDVLIDLKREESLEYSLNGRKLRVRGANSGFTLKERSLPATYRADFDGENSALYVLSSNLAKTTPYGCCIQDYCEGMFKASGHELVKVEGLHAA